MSPAKEFIRSYRQFERDKLYNKWMGVLSANCHKLHGGEVVEVTIPEDAHPEAVQEAIAKLQSEGWRVVRLVPNDTRLMISVMSWSFWRWLGRALKM